MRLRAVIVVSTVALAACAAVTGLGDYEIVPDAVDATLAIDGARSPSDSGTADVFVSIPDAAVDDAVAPPPIDCVDGGDCGIVNESGILDVAASATALFWIDSSNHVRTAGLDGSNVKDLVTGETAPLIGIEVVNDKVFWTSGLDLRTVSTAGGTATTTATVQGVASCLRYGYSRLLVGVPSKHEILAFTSTGTGPTGSAANTTNVVGVEANDPIVTFLTTSGANGSVAILEGSEPNPHTIVSGQANPRCLVLTGSDLYWGNHDTGELRRANPAGGDATTLTTGQTGINGIATSGSFLYWTWDGGIRRRPR